MKKHVLLGAVCSVLIAVTPFLFLFSRNAEYLLASQAMIVAGALVVFSLGAYFLVRLFFRSEAAALLGGAALWIAFYAFRSAFQAFNAWLGIRLLLAAYILLTLLLITLAGFLGKRLRLGGWTQALGLFLAVMFFMNGVPSVQLALQEHDAQADISELKTDGFVLNAQTSPHNVYWIHADGMLSVDAQETYFGEDPTHFAQGLEERGFSVNRSAQFEAAHTTQIAVTALMCPDYYDRRLAQPLSTHEGAMALLTDQGYLKNELQLARIYNETVFAFKARGYRTETLSSYGIWFTPLVDKFYNARGYDGGYLMPIAGSNEEKVRWFTNNIKAHEMATLLLENLGKVLMRSTYPRQKLAYEMDEEALNALLIHPEGKSGVRNLIRCLYDSIQTQGPAFRLINMEEAHSPFACDENGLPCEDPTAVQSYAPNAQYAQKLLLGMVDMILEKDPDAVIVIQGDHGLHQQSAQALSEAFGEGAVLPLWNSVISAIRLPEDCRTEDLARALDTPLNMSRYLVNTFVGENYEYVS